MAQKFTVPITVKQLASAGSDAVTVYVDQDTFSRLKVEAGGRLTWGSGASAGDVNLYRASADVLQTDDTFKTPILFVDNIEIDPTGATTDQVLKFDGTKFIASTSPSGATSLDGLTDVVITTPEEFQTLEYNGTNWVNAYASTVTYVRNAEATTLTTGTVVYLFGATGDHATVKRADKASDVTSSKTVGLVGANITASNNGPVVTRGYVDGIDLSVGYSSGDVLWLGSNGQFTKTKAIAPDHLVFVGVVVRATNNGIVYVATQNGYELDELHNVSLPSPNVGDVLTYNGSLWTAASAGGGGASVTISDTPPASPTAGNLWFESDTTKTYIYYGSAWVEVGSIPTIHNLNDIGDVQAPTPTTGQVLQWNGTYWVPAVAAGGGLNTTTDGALMTMAIGA